jgi:hypothetical protein
MLEKKTGRAAANAAMATKMADPTTPARVPICERFGLPQARWLDVASTRAQQS